MSACKTCRHFEQSPTPPLTYLGRCGLALPPWLAALLDLSVHTDRTVRVEATCSFHEPPEIGDDEIDWEDIYGVGGQG